LSIETIPTTNIILTVITNAKTTFIPPDTSSKLFTILFSANGSISIVATL
jgi:hypothetical protein